MAVSPRTRKRATDAEIETKQDDPFDDLVASFRAALTEFGDGHVKIFMKGPRETRHAYLRSESIGDGDMETFIDALREDYPKGGDFLLKLCDDKGTIRATRQIQLAPLPRSDIEKQTGNKDNSADMFMMFMQMQNQNMQAQAQASRDMINVMMQLNAQSQQSTQAMMTAIIPALAGQKGESASQMLASIAAIQRDLMPQRNEEDGVEKTLKLMEMVKNIMPEGGGSDDGSFVGLLSKAAPLLAGLAAQAPQQQPQRPPAPAQQFPPSAQFVPQLPPQTQAPQIPQQIQQPQDQTPQPEMTPEMQAQLQIIQTYDPIMRAVKTLLEKDADADRLYDYISDQIDAGVVTDEDFGQLVAGLKAQPDQVPYLLAIWNIHDVQHVEIVKQCLALFLADYDDSARDSGDETDVSDHGAIGDSGVAGANDTSNIS